MKTFCALPAFTPKLAIALAVCALALVGTSLAGNPVAGGGRKADNQQKEDLKKQVEDMHVHLENSKKRLPELAHWRRLSLSAPIDSARLQYRKALEELIRNHELLLESFQAQPDTASSVFHPEKPGKVPIWQGVNFTIRVKAKLANLVSFLKAFQSLPIMHRIRTMTIESGVRPNEKDDLFVQMAFEGLAIVDAEKAKTSVPPDGHFPTIDALSGMHTGAPRLAMLAWYISPQGPFVPALLLPLPERTYEAIAQMSFFDGAPSPKLRALAMPERPTFTSTTNATTAGSSLVIACESHNATQETMDFQPEDLQALKAKYEKDLKALNTEIVFLQTLNDWKDSSFSWLDELYNLAARFPWHQSVVISRIQASADAAKANDKRFRARLIIGGLVDSEKVAMVDGFRDVINKDTYCHCTVASLSKMNDGRVQFSMFVELMVKPRHAYRDRLVLPKANVPKKMGK